MKRSKFSEAQVAFILRQVDPCGLERRHCTGTQICRHENVSCGAHHRGVKCSAKVYGIRRRPSQCILEVFVLFSNEDLSVLRRAYAKHVTFSAGVESSRLEAAFAAVPREVFMGEGPWPVFTWDGYRVTPTADPVYLYDDVRVGLKAERGLNNGMPSVHVGWLEAVHVQQGDHVVHIGAGSGYYSGILAHLVGPSGKVTAIEYDPELAARAADNLRDWENVTVVNGDGAAVDFEAADVIYICAGVTHPVDNWLDRLKPKGRLLLPLTTDQNFAPSQAASSHGAVFVIERQSYGFDARWLSQVIIFPCEGMRDVAAEQALAAALQNRRWAEVTRLYRTETVPEDRCWLKAPGWILAYS